MSTVSVIWFCSMCLRPCRLKLRPTHRHVSVYSGCLCVYCIRPQRWLRHEIPEPALSSSGAPIWGYSGFSRDQNNRDMSCGLSVKINMRETLHGARRSKIRFVCVCSRVCGRQKSESSQDWRRHYRGRYISSVISFLYLWGNSKTNNVTEYRLMGQP